jgi:signal transduction histidine kinase
MLLVGVLLLIYGLVLVFKPASAPRLAQPVLSHSTSPLTAQLHNFAEAISGVVELDELIQMTLNQLKTVYGLSRGALILVEPSKTANENEGYMTLRPHEIGLGAIPPGENEVVMSGVLLKRLLVERRPLLQNELETVGLSDSEKAFFNKMDLAIYAPVVAQGNFIGVLAVGPKGDGQAYKPEEIDLLLTVANQVGTVLRNARLVYDLRRREKEAADANIALNQAKQQLEDLDAVKTDFITIASHELRTPLAQIRGYTDIITALNDQGMLDPEQLKNMTDNLRKATDRMEELIRNMLDVSQLDVNAMDLRLAPVSLNNVVKMAIEPLTEAIRDRKLSLSARGLRDLPQVDADMKRMVQAFQNVIVNAVKFTPDGGRIEIEGSLRKNEQGNDEILVAIIDTGIGIDAKNKEIIFEKFVRTQDPSLHSTGKTKFMGAGPGLGLTIARGVIDGHGGRIWVESSGYDSNNYPGSTFFIALPVKASEKASGVLRFDNTSSSIMNRTELLQQLEAHQAGNG